MQERALAQVFPGDVGVVVRAQIARHPGIASALFEVLETQNMLASTGLRVDSVPAGTPLLYSFGTSRMG